jgi:hypothetical protein
MDAFTKSLGRNTDLD